MSEGLALRFEPRPWEPQTAVSAMSRAARSRSGKPYQAAVPPAIATLAIMLEGEVLAAADDARAEIARFDGELGALVGDGEFAPLASVLLRTESASSSQIENITTSAKSLALAELGIAKYGSNAKLVVANVDAMRRALDGSAEVTPDAILSIHEALMRGQSYADPGRFRSEQVWIGGRAEFPHDADFIPPHHTRVRDTVEDLCEFTRRVDLPLVAQVAVAHAQFETIHPFNDGNGRTGRALVHAMLKHGGATTRTTVPVSAGLLGDVGSYVDALTAYRAGDPNPIVSRFCDATFAAVSNGRRLATDLAEIHREWRARLTARSDSVAWRALPILLAHPAVTSRALQDRTGASQPAVDRALRQLEAADILRSRDEHGEGSTRNVVWRSDEVLGALEEFADRSRRRRGS